MSDLGDIAAENGEALLDLGPEIDLSAAAASSSAPSTMPTMSRLPSAPCSDGSRPLHDERLPSLMSTRRCLRKMNDYRTLAVAQQEETSAA